MHALAEYGAMHVKLYEDIARYGQIAISYDYPVMVNGRYLMSPCPIPAFDNPKMHRMPALAAVRRRAGEAHLRHPALHRCALASISRTIRSAPSARRMPARCAAMRPTYLDEVVTDDRGGRMFVCSDTDYCAERRGERGEHRERAA